MRIKILQRPALDFVDGIRLDRFEPGQQYEVGSALGAHLVVEGWAALIRSEEPALLVPLGHSTRIPDFPFAAHCPDTRH